MPWPFRKSSWDLAALEKPWGDRSSLYEYIRARLQPGDKGLEHPEEPLPDEEVSPGAGRLRWGAGVLDGIFGHHSQAGEEADQLAGQLYQGLKKFLKDPQQKHLNHFYDTARGEHILSSIDPLLKLIATDSGIPAKPYTEFAEWLVRHAADRSPVKLGIAMLGLTGDPAFYPLFMTIGSHEEFTLYAAVALSYEEKSAKANLFSLARRVHGWGRIHTVKRLAPLADQEIKAWLLREGFKNSVMYEYLVLPCAVHGELKAALDNGSLNDEILAGAGDIISTLISGEGGPAQGISDYEDSLAVVQKYLELLEPRVSRLEEFLVVETIDSFMKDEEWDWKHLASHGWNREIRSGLSRKAESILKLPVWPQKVTEGLASKDDEQYWAASKVASYLGIDTWDMHISHLRSGKDLWYELAKTKNPDRMQQLIELAEELIPLDQIEVGPGTELGLGKEFMPHQSLDWILQELGRFPGTGARLIRVGLRSPVTRNRNFAVRVLHAWGKSRWPEDFESLIRQSLDIEPDTEVKERLSKLLAGKNPFEGS